MLLVASCYRNRDKLRPGGPHWPVCRLYPTLPIKRKATDDLFRPASATVDEVLLQGMETAAAMPTLARLAHLARAASRCRQSKRPQDPVDLDFNMDESSILEGFLRADIETREKRHLIFATEEQLTLFNKSGGKAKRWYVDGIFKLCRPPSSYSALLD